MSLENVSAFPLVTSFNVVTTGAALLAEPVLWEASAPKGGCVSMLATSSARLGNVGPTCAEAPAERVKAISYAPISGSA